MASTLASSSTPRRSSSCGPIAKRTLSTPLRSGSSDIGRLCLQSSSARAGRVARPNRAGTRSSRTDGIRRISDLLVVAVVDIVRLEAGVGGEFGHRRGQRVLGPVQGRQAVAQGEGGFADLACIEIGRASGRGGGW